MKLVLLPGLDGTGNLFAPFIKVLPDRYSPLVIAYPTNASLTLPELVEFTHARLPENEDCVLVAESFSGPVAIELAARQPQHLKALVLCATFVSNPAPFSVDFSSFLREWQFAISPPKVLIKRFLVGWDAPNSLLNELLKTLRTVSPEVLASRSRSLFKINVRQAFRECRVPVLYLMAKRDKLLKRSSLKEMLELKPEMRVIEIEGPHLLIQRQPQACYEAIEHFTERHSKQG